MFNIMVCAEYLTWSNNSKLISIDTHDNHNANGSLLIMYYYTFDMYQLAENYTSPILYMLYDEVFSLPFWVK